MKAAKSYRYRDLRERLRNEWPIYLLAFLFILIALPFALLLGLKRESIGATQSIARPISR